MKQSDLARIAELDPWRQQLVRDELARRMARIRLAKAYPTPYDLAVALDPTTVQTPALAKLDEALVKVDAGIIRKLMIFMPPQEGKSTRVARVGSLWALRQNPNRRMAIVSYADTLASGHGGWVRDQIVTHGLHAPLDGSDDRLGLSVKASSRSQSRWELEGARGSLIAAGLRGGITGKPIDWLTIDDPFASRQEADSKVIREMVWSWYTDVALARAPRVIVLIMTRWHEDDLAGRLLNEDAALAIADRQWTVINIPAQADPRVMRDGSPDLLGRVTGEYLESARGRSGVDEAPLRDEAFWLEKKRNARTWSALYQGNPTPAEGGMFKWDWIRPYRVAEAPHLAKVGVAVDPTGGGSDEAGIIVSGRGADGRWYVIGDRSGPYTAGGQWRVAWLACLEFDADVMIYEKNLVDPVMRKAIPAAWKRMREQALALEQAGVLALDEANDPPEMFDAGVELAARELAHSGDDDVLAASDPLAALTEQLLQVLPWAAAILAAPERGPVRVDGVSATKGKRIRADPMSQAYETGLCAHVGSYPDFENELTTWQEGQDSPNRLDAGVWGWTYLHTRTTVARTGVARGSVPTGTAAALGNRPR